MEQEKIPAKHTHPWLYLRKSRFSGKPVAQLALDGELTDTAPGNSQQQSPRPAREAQRPLSSSRTCRREVEPYADTAGCECPRSSLGPQQAASWWAVHLLRGLRRALGWRWGAPKRRDLMVMQKPTHVCMGHCFSVVQCPWSGSGWGEGSASVPQGPPGWRKARVGRGHSWAPTGAGVFRASGAYAKTAPGYVCTTLYIHWKYLIVHSE